MPSSNDRLASFRKSCTGEHHTFNHSILTHPSTAKINYNDFGIGGFSSTVVDSTSTHFTFSGSHFAGQNELRVVDPID